MNIFIVTVGSRGDVQPYVALGKGLQKVGHVVTLCTASRFESFVTKHGLRYGYMNDDMLKLMDSDQGRDLMENTTNVWEIVKANIRLYKQVGPMQHTMLNDSWAAAQQANPDLIIFHPKSYGDPHFAEKLGIPVMLVIPLPMFVPTTETPSLGFPKLPFGGWYNRFTYQFVNIMMGLSTKGPVKTWRSRHGLPSNPNDTDILHTSAGKHIPVLHCYSKHVGLNPSDWPANVVATDYWFLDQEESWHPPQALQDFLAAGDPPVYVGFGSMAGRNPQRLTRIVIEALQQARVRGIIATGWSGLDTRNLPDTIFKLDQLPHDWLFPRVSAVVHHGGAGTTVAGLRAGRPIIVCPFFGDQPFWGQRVHTLGVGSKPIPQKQLTVEKLATAIREVTTSPTIRQRAESVGEQIRREDGVGNTVALIERMVVTV